ncbi:DUF2059 domain-containing protein [Tabrizicola thermarum]|uniref:DUF2059 domain-containing protein n=1 Tax=Tabrizicola thermarum TaxID=2670345 RepID=UPI000FFBF5B5|nr:DUF2059 domain-containing protein [Tabrizicola thermarum]
MLLSRLVLAAVLAIATPLAAETVADRATTEVAADKLGEVLQLDALFAVLRDEGLAHGTTLEADMFPSGGGAAWKDAVSAIYDTGRLRAGFDAALTEQLGADPETVDAIVAFFGSDLGRKIVGLEIEARRAFLDTAAEEAARVAADDAAAARDPKVAQIRRMIEAADLLEMNVAGSMSGNLAFMTGIAGTGAYGPDMPEDQILSDIWGQEDQIRADTSTWLYAYLGLAYAPLSKDEMEAYIAFWESPAGQRLNAALFTAFDRVFRQVSHDLGRAAGQAMQGRDI